MQEALRDARKAHERGVRVGGASRHVDDDEELLAAVTRGEDLHERIRVGQRRRLRRHDDQHVGGRRREEQDVRRDTGGGIDEQHVRLRFERLHHTEQA